MALAKGIRAGRAFVELFADSSKLVRGLRQAEAKLRAFGRNLQSAGKRMLLLSGVMAAPFVGGIKVFADFETQMAEVATLLDNAGEHMGGFRKEIRRMSIEFGQSTQTLARGLFDIISATVPADEALGVLEAGAKLAVAGLTDTGVTVDALTTLLNAYGFSANKAADLSDLFFQTAKRGKTTVALLAPNIGKVATLAATAGLSVEEFGAALASLTRVGLKTEDSATALRAILVSFLKPAKQSADRARELGFELSSAQLKAEGLLKIFERMRTLSPEDIAILFPNVRAIIGVFPLLRRLSGFEEDLEILTDRVGATEKAFKKLAGTVAFAFRQIREAATVVLSVVGEALAEKVTLVVKLATVLLNAAGVWVSANKQMVVAGVKTVLIIAGVGAVLLALGVAVVALSAVLGLLPNLLLLIAAPLALVKGALAILVPAFSLLLSPLGLMTAAWVTLAVVMGDFEGVVRNVVRTLVQKFTSFKESVAQSLQGIVDAIMSGDLALAAKILWLTVKVEFERGIQAISEAWSDFRDFFIRVASDAFSAMLAALEIGLSGLESAWIETTAFLSGVWVDFAAGMRVVWDSVQNWLTKRWIDLFGLFGSLTEEQVAAAKALADEDLVQQFITIEERRVRQLDDTEKERAARQEQREKETEGTLAVIGAANLALRRRQEDEFQAQRIKNEEALAKARVELDKLIGGARVQRLEGVDEEGPIGKILRELRTAVTTVGDASDVTTRGAFVAANILGFQSGQVASKMVTALDKIERNTRPLRKPDTLAFG